MPDGIARIIAFAASLQEGMSVRIDVAGEGPGEMFANIARAVGEGSGRAVVVYDARGVSMAGFATGAGVDALLTAREAARGRKDWPEADRLRDELRALGVVVEDTKQGQTWRRL